jgi:predicted DNA repair protein MutK
MSAGLFGLLDDVAALARLAAASIDDVGAAAAKATAKASGVVVDDTAVTPQYVHGIAAERELPIIKKIALGSLRNKLLFILPVAMLLSQFLPAGLPILLIIGGTYLAFEGAEKVYERFAHRDDLAGDLETVEHTPAEEKTLIAGAVRTDFILSTEIMVIALDSVADEKFGSRLAIMLVVAFAITIGVYGVVAAIVKMDDVGLSLAQRRSSAVQFLGRSLVAAMPRILTMLSAVGIVAMLWVGGHILLVNVAELGWWEAPYDAVHALEHEAHVAVEHAGSALASFAGAAGWLVNTVCSALAGLLVGAVVVVVMHLVPRRSTSAAH